MKICSPQRQQIAKRSPAMHRDGEDYLFWNSEKSLARAMAGDFV
jgi:hypothetical protein